MIEYAVFDRTRNFLSAMKQSNQEIDEKVKREGIESVSIENVGDQEEFVDMDVGVVDNSLFQKGPLVFLQKDPEEDDSSLDDEELPQMLLEAKNKLLVEEVKPAE